MKKSFTLMELLIVIGLLALISVVALVLFDPRGQIVKGQDSKRKTELIQLSKEFEDYYNDKNCYPRPQEVCYDFNPSSPLNCHICGNESASPSFSPYLSKLPCDPLQPNKKYFYQVNDANCPGMYWIYTTLSIASDPATQEYCSSDGSGQTDYNWGVASTNVRPLINCNKVTLTLTPTMPPTSIPSTPTPSIPIPTLTPAPDNYYCQSYNNCSYFDKNVWNCSPSFLDPLCSGSNNCTSQIGTCIK